MLGSCCGACAQVVFAYARLGAYDRQLFDAAAKEITRTAEQGLSVQAASQVCFLCIPGVFLKHPRCVP